MLPSAHLVVPEVFFKLLLAFGIVERISQWEVMFKQVGIHSVKLVELIAKRFCYWRLLHHHDDVIVV